MFRERILVTVMEKTIEIILEKKNRRDIFVSDTH
jgi:hypothetical protein